MRGPVCGRSTTGSGNDTMARSLSADIITAAARRSEDQTSCARAIRQEPSRRPRHHRRVAIHPCQDLVVDDAPIPPWHPRNRRPVCVTTTSSRNTADTDSASRNRSTVARALSRLVTGRPILVLSLVPFTASDSPSLAAVETCDSTVARPPHPFRRLRPQPNDIGSAPARSQELLQAVVHLVAAGQQRSSLKLHCRHRDGNGILVETSSRTESNEHAPSPPAARPSLVRVPGPVGVGLNSEHTRTSSRTCRSRSGCPSPTAAGARIRAHMQLPVMSRDHHAARSAGTSPHRADQPIEQQLHETRVGSLDRPPETAWSGRRCPLRPAEVRRFARYPPPNRPRRDRAAVSC